MWLWIYRILRHHHFYVVPPFSLFCPLFCFLVIGTKLRNPAKTSMIVKLTTLADKNQPLSKGIGKRWQCDGYFHSMYLLEQSIRNSFPVLVSLAKLACRQRLRLIIKLRRKWLGQKNEQEVDSDCCERAGLADTYVCVGSFSKGYWRLEFSRLLPLLQAQ